MKKALLFLVGTLLGVSLFAQHAATEHVDPRVKSLKMRPAEQQMGLMTKGQTNYRLEGFASSDGEQIATFHYNNGQLIAVLEEVYGDDGYQLYDSIRYNDQGQIVKIDGYQWLYGGWYHVYYVEYGYNAQGLIATRTNYNNIEGWNIGGVYRYRYNANGQIIETVLEMGSMIITSIAYTYENGILATEAWESYDFYTDELMPYELIEYNYSNGLLTLADHFSYNENGGREWKGSENYTYDNSSNCTEYQHRNGADQVIERRLYTYDSRTLAETHMPWHPEIERPYLYTNHNLYTTEEFYTVDVENILRHFCDYTYDYINLVAIDEVAAESLVECYPNPTQGSLTISAPEGETVKVYDMMGRCIMTLVSKGRIELQLPQSGLYLVRVGNSTSKVVCQ